jgi:hypothetical protein
VVEQRGRAGGTSGRNELEGLKDLAGLFEVIDVRGRAVLGGGEEGLRGVDEDDALAPARRHRGRRGREGRAGAMGSCRREGGTRNASAGGRRAIAHGKGQARSARQLLLDHEQLAPSSASTSSLHNSHNLFETYERHRPAGLQCGVRTAVTWDRRTRIKCGVGSGAWATCLFQHTFPCSDSARQAESK